MSKNPKTCVCGGREVTMEARGWGNILKTGSENLNYAPDLVLFQAMQSPTTCLIFTISQLYSAEIAW